MIAFLKGRLAEKHPNRVIVDVGGVGYDVQVPLSTFYALGDSGAEVALRVHTHVREDALALFGFATPLELALFERLIAIPGIGFTSAAVVTAEVWDVSRFPSPEELCSWAGLTPLEGLMEARPR